jgi:methyl-accepting chemotaxis protein
MDRETNETPAAGALIAAIAAQVGNLSVEIADVVGHTTAVQAATNAQNSALKSLGDATLDITEANRRIAEMALQTSETAGRARADIGRSSHAIEQAIREVGGLVSAVEEAGGELAGLESAMSRVAQVTNVTEQVRRLTERMSVSGERAAQVGRTASSIGGAVATVGQAMGPVCDHAAEIARSTQDIAQRCDSFTNSVGVLNADAARSTAAIAEASGNLARLLSGAEQIMMQTACSGFPTEDTPFIEQARSVARAVEERMSQAVANGEITIDDLFDGELQPIAGTNPQQYMTRYIPFLDRAIVPLMDPVLENDRRIVFCAPGDHNRLIPCHNAAFRLPQGPDPLWNAVHCRNRRIFADKTNEAASTSTAPFLLQTYRRDMGGGVFVLMKDASAPIRVGGRVWGGLRVCYMAKQ